MKDCIDPKPECIRDELPPFMYYDGRATKLLSYTSFLSYYAATGGKRCIKEEYP